MAFSPSPQQQDFFDWTREGRGSATLEAVAGAGKTTTLMEASDLMQGSVSFVAFNSKIAKEMGERLLARGHRPYGREGKSARTFHSVGLSMLREAFPDQGWARDPRDSTYTTDKKVVRIAEQLIQETGRTDLIGLESAIAGMVSMAKQRGIGALPDMRIDDLRLWAEMVYQFSLDDALPEGQEHMVAQAIRLSVEALRRSSADLSVIDYDDMIYLPLLRNLRVKWRSDWVVIDEAQDTNPTRRAIAARMLKPGGRLVAVGDPRQAIYGFTGTDNDSMDQLAQQFDAVRLPLTVTYRCPRAVVREAQRFVSHIQSHPSSPEGEVVRYDYEEIMGRVEVGDAVLCRYNKYLVSLVFRLIRSGVAAKIEGRSIGEGLIKLATRWRSIRTLNALESRLATYFEREVEKARAREDERKMEEHRDRHETMLVLIERAREAGHSQVDELVAMIRSVFGDDVSGERVVTLCSIHRSKGLEWDRVHIMGLDEVQPAPCSRDWQHVQEINLQYVAVTRAKQTLHLVSGVRE